MTAPEHHHETSAADGGHAPVGWLRRHRALIVICLLFAGLRLPVAWRQVPAQDEEYFVVPGLTILRDGVPRIPYMPSRNPRGAFYKADELLFTLPPLYFYCEAVVYQCIGASTGAARFVSMLCAIGAIVVVHRLARLLFHDESSALWSAGLYAASRAIYFPAMVARPDMLCGLLGLGALLACTRWTESRRRILLIAAGALIGAAGLTHPFALVPAIQVTAWTLIASRGWSNRLRNVGTLAAAVLLVFLLWVPLIAVNPEAFQSQFYNAVLNQSGPGLVSRLILPYRSLLVQAPIFLEHVGLSQAVLMIGATAAAAVLAARLPDEGLRTGAVLACTGLYLHVACVGGHPTRGYWCYTGALMFLCVGGLLSQLRCGLVAAVPPGMRAPRPRSRAQLRTLFLAAAIMLPGAGLRTIAAHLRHWNDINYDAPRFTRELMAAVPADARLVVDPKYVFDLYRDGRHVTLAMDYDFFFSVRGTEYDFVVAGPYSIRDGIPATLGAKFVKAYGDQDDLFSCYAEIYTSPEEVPRR
ncbi:MAG: glycosyltransferase family 39 protein [Planctomycetaceae bacterium]|nr:glycosyltransferase family 39 protein [Planctomycetaceae bacterium]